MKVANFTDNWGRGGEQMRNRCYLQKEMVSELSGNSFISLEKGNFVYLCTCSYISFLHVMYLGRMVESIVNYHLRAMAMDAPVLCLNRIH